IDLVFQTDGIAEIAEVATQVNDSTENIGARRLHTILEKLLDEVSFNAPDMTNQAITIDSEYVTDKIADIVQDRDLSRYIL
ncbi:MAG: HslU--HslV peptidase ATPase subunit, partial [Thermodesulfobacteriota bacterium]